MTVRIPKTIFEGLGKWMMRGPWHTHLQEAIDDHLHAYCDMHDIDDFDALADKIGGHWVSTLNDMALNDFLGRETEDGNVVDLYLKRRGWNETRIARDYLEGIRDTAVSLYEVSDIRPGESFLARDLIRGGDPVRVSERTATKTMAPWEHFVMRIVMVRNTRILAGGLLPCEPDLSAELRASFERMVRTAQDGLDGALREAFEDHAAEAARVACSSVPPESVQDIVLDTILKSSSPFFAKVWLMGTPLDPADGDEVEFIRLHCRFRKGTTQEKIRAILDAEDDMAPAAPKVWNWIDPERTARLPEGRTLPPGGQMYKSELEDGSVVLGMLTLSGRVLEAEINSPQRAERLMTRLPDLLDAYVSPPIMVRQTVEQSLAAHRESGQSPAPVDLSPEEQARFVHAQYDRHYRDTLDQPLGMLDGRTPRDAARTAAGREQVAAWLKHLERDEAKMRKDRDVPAYDFTWMWSDLGIEDLRR